MSSAEERSKDVNAQIDAQNFAELMHEVEKTAQASNLAAQMGIDNLRMARRHRAERDIRLGLDPNIEDSQNAAMAASVAANAAKAASNVASLAAEAARLASEIASGQSEPINGDAEK